MACRSGSHDFAVLCIFTWPTHTSGRQRARTAAYNTEFPLEMVEHTEFIAHSNTQIFHSVVEDYKPLYLCRWSFLADIAYFILGYIRSGCIIVCLHQWWRICRCATSCSNWRQCIMTHFINLFSSTKHQTYIYDMLNLILLAFYIFSYSINFAGDRKIEKTFPASFLQVWNLCFVWQ